MPIAMFLAVVVVVPLVVSGQNPDELEELAVRALNPVDGLAVLQGPEGDLQTVRVGDTLRNGYGRVVNVLEDRLVVETLAATEGKRTLWLFKADPSQKKSRIVTLDRKRPVETWLGPASIETNPPQPNQKDRRLKEKNDRK